MFPVQDPLNQKQEPKPAPEPAGEPGSISTPFAPAPGAIPQKAPTPPITPSDTAAPPQPQRPTFEPTPPSPLEPTFPERPDKPPISTLPGVSAEPATFPLQEVPEPASSTSRIVNFALLLIGPLFMVVSLTFAFFLTQSNTPTQLPAEPEKKEKTTELKVRTEWLSRLKQLPKNPDSVTATCQSTKESLTSGKPTSCPDPVFIWSGAQVFEPNTKIAGYNVCFGENGKVPYLLLTEPEKKDLFEIDVFQSSNTYRPANLIKGKTYYLLAQTVSTSLSPLLTTGGKLIDSTTGKIETASLLFEYIYE